MAQNQKKRAELELLIDSKGAEDSDEDFKYSSAPGDTKSKDKRFDAIQSNKEFAIDPTHKEYKKKTPALGSGSNNKVQKRPKKKQKLN